MADTLPVHPGDLVADKYVVEEVIGRGGMGVVVAARHHGLDQRVAIKFLDRKLRDRDEAVRRFLREARAVANLKSQHVVRVIDTGTVASGEPYLVMELLEGDDLEGVLHDRSPLDVSLASDWMAQACEALAEAHASGLVHRDLKPSNLFLARTVGGAEIIKVLDFGIAKAVEAEDLDGPALTDADVLLGSPKYMAPEQMRSSRDVDARADVWALGVVLFELLTKQRPFQAAALPDLCLKVATEPPLSLSDLRPDVPAGLVDVVLRCLAKDPAARFGNAGEVAAALEPYVSARSRTVIERARRAAVQPPRKIAPSLPEVPPPPRPTASESVDIVLEAGGTPSARRTRPHSRPFQASPVARRASSLRDWGVGVLLLVFVIAIAAWSQSSWLGRPGAATISVSASPEEAPAPAPKARLAIPTSTGEPVPPSAGAAAQPDVASTAAAASVHVPSAPAPPLRHRAEAGAVGEHGPPLVLPVATPWPDGSDIPAVR